MSELKRHHINEVMDMHNLTRGKMGYSFVYYADDVDKVIAEKDKVIAYAQALVLKDIEIIRHHKYRHCLDMARWCGDACDKWMMRKAKAISLGKDGVEEYHRARRKLFHYMKWQTRWLELAEKFKEAK